MSQNAITPAKPRKLVAPTRKLKHALRLRVEDNKSWDDCARAAGLSPAGLHKARKRQNVIELYEQMKTTYIQEIEDLKRPWAARALAVAADLMDNAQSETVRARMVEFFAGEKRGPAVAVQINTAKSETKAAGQPMRGYEYLRPGQELVRIITPDRPTQPDIIDVELEQD